MFKHPFAIVSQLRFLTVKALIGTFNQEKAHLEAL